MHPLSPREVSPPGYIRPRAPDLPPTPAEIDRQRHWEAEAVEAGIRRYREEVHNLAIADTSPGQRIIREIMAKFVPYLADLQAMEREGFYKPGRSEEWILLLHLLPPETLAFLTLRAVMGERPSNEDHLRTFFACAGSLATMIETEADFLELKDEVRAEKREARALGKPYEDVIEKMKRTNKVIDRRAFRNMEKACGRLERQGWPNTLRMQLGGKLIEHMVDCTGGACFEIGTAYTGVVARKAGKAARKTPRVIKLTPKARELVEDQHARMELLMPIRRPMKCQPRVWEWDGVRDRYVGGYYQIPDSGRIHGGGGGKHTATLTRPFSAETLRAVNTLQDTPWQINRAVFKVMEDAMLAGLPIVPPADNKPLPDYLPEEVWDALSDAERLEHKKAREKIHRENASLEGKRYSWLMKRDMAEKLLDEPKIWFPWYADFRGRLYPEVSDLTPQGNDASKALLRFAHGKPLGEDGLWWLYVRAANCYAAVEGPVAVDKQAWADRYQWTERNIDRILEAAQDPLDGISWWIEAEDPWCFLATCFEITAALQLDNPEEFISHLPVNLDGSCNGLQHLAAMGRDRAGCEATNVIPSKDRKRGDIYDEVKESVKAQVAVDAGKGDEMAKLWLGNVDRKTVKRLVMTTAYGVTERGMARQLIEDDLTVGMGDNKQQQRAAAYLQKVIVKALDEKLGSAKAIMGWLQAVAEALAQHDIPFRWRTPTGNEIEQAYWQQGEQRVITLHGKISLWVDRPGTKLQLTKQKQSAAPNVVHSFDASHLVRTINACSDIWHQLYDFSAIHDSYGVHPGDASVLSNILRRELARMYETNWLQALEGYVRSYAPEVDIPSWTEHVALGELDLAREMHQADYAFA
jgi:DNA-directed RNA polymerase